MAKTTNLSWLAGFLNHQQVVVDKGEMSNWRQSGLESGASHMEQMTWTNGSYTLKLHLSCFDALTTLVGGCKNTWEIIVVLGTSFPKMLVGLSSMHLDGWT